MSGVLNRRLFPCLTSYKHRMVVTEGYDVLVSTLELSDVVHQEDRYGRIRLGNHQGSHELLR